MRLRAAGFYLVILIVGGCQASSGQEAAVCRAVQLEPFVQQPECGSGRCITGLDLRNVSSKSCSLPRQPKVSALTKSGALLRREDLEESGSSLVLKPGQFGKYQSGSFSSDEFRHSPKTAAVYLFHLRADDVGSIRFPGNQSLLTGPRSAFDDGYIAGMSSPPQETNGKLVFSAFQWPITQERRDKAKLTDPDDPGLELHVSLSNQAVVNQLSWASCHIVIVTSEDGTTNAESRLESPCAWNGDIRFGAIAAGATVALEATAKIPKVCHRARYKIAVSMENAPVMSKPLILHTDELQPLCSDSNVVKNVVLEKDSLPPGLKSRDVEWGLPVDGIRLGLSILAHLQQWRCSCRQ